MRRNPGDDGFVVWGRVSFIVGDVKARFLVKRYFGDPETHVSHLFTQHPDPIDPTWSVPIIFTRDLYHAHEMADALRGMYPYVYPSLDDGMRAMEQARLAMIDIECDEIEAVRKEWVFRNRVEW